MSWSGKWPAPYWFAVGLGTLLAYGVLMPGLKHLVWVIPFACLLVYVTWFFEFGIYHSWVFRHFRFRYLGYWSENLSTLIMMAGYVLSLLYLRGAGKGLRLVLGIELFLGTFFVLFILANTVCSIYLPTDGTFGVGFDHDIFGFRLGLYYLITVSISVFILRLVVKDKAVAPNQSPEPTAVGAVSSAIAVHAASRRWLSFFR